MTRVIMLRHGETLWNREQRMQGQADVGLSELGRRQAAAAAQALAGERLETIWASPLQRAADTARTVAEVHQMDVHLDARLTEINIGDWAGRTWADVCREYPGQAQRIRRGEDFRRSATGETAEEMAQRGKAVLSEIVATHPTGTVLVVTHGLFTRVVVGHLLGLRGYGRHLGTLTNAHWAELRYEHELWLLSGYNLGGSAQS